MNTFKFALSSLFVAILFLSSCQEIQPTNTNSKLEALEFIDGNSDRLFRTTGNPVEEYLWRCNGSDCNIGCYLRFDPSGITCSCETCVVLIVNGPESMLPGDDGYDDAFATISSYCCSGDIMWFIDEDDDDETESTVQLDEQALTIIEGSETYGMRYHYTTEDGSTGNVLFVYTAEGMDTYQCEGDCDCYPILNEDESVSCSCDGCSPIQL